MFWNCLISHRGLVKKITEGDRAANTQGWHKKWHCPSSQKANGLWYITMLIYKNDNGNKWCSGPHRTPAHTVVTYHLDKLMGLALLSSCQQCSLLRPTTGLFITVPSTRGVCKFRLQVTSLVKPLSTAGFSFQSIFSCSPFIARYKHTP